MRRRSRRLEGADLLIIATQLQYLPGSGNIRPPPNCHAILWLPIRITSDAVMLSNPATSIDAAHRISATGGRATRTRTAVLDILTRAGGPLSHDEIASALTSAAITHDRVTLYRTLDWLVEQSLAHRVAGADRAWRFNAVADETHGHAHFQCNGCGGVFCLESLKPAIAAALPGGFSLERAELTFYGRCPSCKPDAPV